MVRRMTRAALHGLLILITLLLVLIAYSWSDRTPPSFVIAMWVTPYELQPEQPFTTIEIFVRNRLCTRHIEQYFVQGETSYILDSPTDLWFPTRYGLIKQGFDNLVPRELKPGSATYVMRLLWVCWWNPITWMNPISFIARYNVKVVPPDVIDFNFDGHAYYYRFLDKGTFVEMERVK